MPTGRVHGMRLTAPVPPAGSAGRVHGMRLAGTAPTGSRGRVHNVRLAGQVPTGSKGRIHGARLAGSIAMVVQSIPTVTVEPGVRVDVTAVMLQGTPDTYVWRVISAPQGVTVALAGTGPARTFRTPALLAGATVVLGVKARTGTADSNEVTATVIARPQIEWVQFHNQAWRPRNTVII